MRFAAKLVLGIAVLFGLATSALAQSRIVFVTHGQSGDPYWSVVKNGMDDAAKALGVKAEYLSPETFDMVKMAQLIDTATASKPDGLVVSIPDAAALGGPVKEAVAAGIPVIVIDSGGSKLTKELGGLLYLGQSEYEAGRHCRRARRQARREESRMPQSGSGQLQPRRPLRRICQRSGRRSSGRAGRDRPDRNEEPRACAISTPIPTSNSCWAAVRRQPNRRSPRSTNSASRARSNSARSTCRPTSFRRSWTAMWSGASTPSNI